MVFLGEAFYGRGESLNLSFKGDGTWFVPLIVIGGRHRVSKYHVTFCSRSGSMAYFLSIDLHRRRQLMMPKIINKSHSPYILNTRLAQHTHKKKKKKKKKKKDLIESTGVVPPNILQKLS